MRKGVQVATFLYGILLIVSLFWLAPQMRHARQWGFRAAHANGRVTIVSAEPWTGLRTGDLILAMNGDTRVPSAGIAPFLTRYPAAVPYLLRVQRGSGTFETALQVSIVDSWAVAQNCFLVVVGILCSVMSTWIGWRDSGSRMVRIAWASGMMAALQMLAWGLEASGAGGWAPAPTAYLLFLVGPWKLYVTYLFAAALPTGKPETGGWRWLQRSLLALAVVAAVEALPHDLAHMLPPGETGIRLAIFAGRLLPRPPLWEATVIIFSVAMILVVWRNYRRLTSEDGRRRVRWVVFGLSVASGSLAAAQVLVGLRLADPLLLNAAQLPLVLIPLTLGYAIMRHRVLGVAVVVRQGLQYLLARYSIAALMLAVPATLAARGVLHPDMTLRELIAPPALYGGTLLLAGIGMASRPRILAALDRRFFREAWDREQILSGLLETIRRQHSFRETVDTVRKSIAGALHPDVVEVIYRRKRGGPIESRLGPIPPAWQAPTQSGVVWRTERLHDNSPPEREWLTKHGVELRILIPSQDGVAGFLLLGPKMSEEPYTGRDIQLLRAIAEHLGLAYENHMLAMERAEAVVVERTRIARELHDTLAQGFAGISLHLESARLALAEDTADAGKHLQQARALARVNLAEARRSVFELRETARQASELRRQLLDLAVQLAAGTAVEIQVETHGEMALSERYGSNLFRLAQEAVSNALKHSGATRIDVTVDFGAAGVKLSVRDNGRGFDPSTAGSNGFGLLGMRERVAEIRGRLDVRSELDRGTEICVVAELP